MKETDLNIADMFSDEIMLSDLRQLLDEEMSKSEKERDYDAIKEITAAMVELADDHVPEPPPAETILGKAAEKKRQKFGMTIRRWATALSACFIAVFALNCYTLVTYGENIIEAVLKRTRSGFTLDLSAEPSTPVTTEPTEPSNEITKGQEMAQQMAKVMGEYCWKKAVYPYLPTELPEEMAYNGVFELEEQHYEALEDSKDFSFTFTNGEQYIRINIEKYKSPKNLPEVCIPSDNYEVADEVVNGTHIYAFTNGPRVTAVFTRYSTVYTLSAYNISADGIIKLAESFMPYER